MLLHNRPLKCFFTCFEIITLNAEVLCLEAYRAEGLEVWCDEDEDACAIAVALVS